MKTKYRGLMHEAAVVRTALALGLSFNQIRNYAEELYDLLGIQGEFSYEETYKKMVESNDFADTLCKYCLEKEENYVDFSLEFMNLSPKDYCCKLIIKHHEVKTEILENGEKAVFIEYPDVSWADLKNDLKVAKHLQPLLRLDKEKKPNKFYIVKAPDEHTAYIALKYIAAYIKSHYSILEWYDQTVGEFATDDSFDFTERLPIIHFQEILKQCNAEDNALFQFRDKQGAGLAESGSPYYLESKTCPICIKVDTQFYDIESLKLVDGLQERSHIIILVAPFWNHLSYLFGSGGKDNGEEIVSELEFICATDSLVINKPEIGDGEYYETLLHDFALQLNCRIDPSVNPCELLAMIKRARRELNSQTIEKTVLNAYRRSGNKPVLNMEDFAFLEGKGLVLTYDVKLSAREKFDKYIIGQEKAKRQILDAIACNKMNMIRMGMGLPDSGMHNVFAFIGAPGTAKTTAAQIMGEIMLEEKLLSGNRCISISGAQLKAQYLGQTSHRVHEIMTNYDIIILDEIYGLTGGNHEDSYAQEALAQLCIELEANAQNKLIIFLGYGGSDVDPKDNKMKAFIESNPGIASRISHTIYFESYDPYNDMPRIFEGMARNLGYVLSENSLKLASDFFARRAKCRDFGNGREGRRLLENAIKHQSVRLSERKTYTKGDLEQLTDEDIKKAIREILKGCMDLEGQSPRSIGFKVKQT